ncbi:MAG TPA: DoxX family protein [Burkholderiales bacterium]|jgi:putative oxidoreductase|nr:DoxX family protein [Burkholderiales bacterium]
MNKTCEMTKQYAPLIGRILLAAIFVISGFGKIMAFHATAGYMASRGLPIAEVLLVPTIIIELGGGLMLLLGWNARWAALALFLFIIPTTLIFHPFWIADATQMQNKVNFLKNLAIMGGMLYVMAYGSGRFSLGKKDTCGDNP